jgi:DNA-damage-inducible protein J
MSTVKTATARARIQPEIKVRAEGIIHDLGLSVSAAFELFYRQIILNNGLPFDVRIPNDATRKAIDDVRAGRGKTFDTAEALFEDLDI